MLKDLLKKGDYLVKIERCLPNRTHLAQTPKVSPLPLQRQYVGICMPPLWSCKCPQGVYQGTQACSSCFKTNGVKNNHLFRRYPDYVQIVDLALTHASTALNLLEGPGFVVNYEKSCLEPSQIIEFLGFEINSQTLTILLPRDKIRKIRKKCQDLLDNPNTSVRELSKFLGLLTSSI